MLTAKMYVCMEAIMDGHRQGNLPPSPVRQAGHLRTSPRGVTRAGQLSEPRTGSSSAC